MAVIRQYVNLPTGVTNIHGNRRDLRAAPANIPNVGAGDTTEWWLEPVGGNNVDPQYVDPARRAKVTHATRPFNAGAGAFLNRLELPHVGGDQYLVKVSKQGDRSTFLTTDTFETWRKLYYTLYHVGPPALNFFNGLEARFKDAFARGYLEMECAAKVPAITDAVRINADPYNRQWMDGTADAAIDLRPAGAGALANKPFHVALLVCTDCFYTEDVARSDPTSRTTVGTTDYTHRLYTEGGNPLAFLKQARVRWTGHAWRDVRAHFNLVSTATWNSTIGWDLSPVPGLTNHVAAAPANTFNLEFTVLHEHRLMGYSFCNFCIVRTLDGVTDVLQTFTHEVGHGIGQAVKWEDRWDGSGAPLAPELNPRWYNDFYGGQGPHCNTNAVLGAQPGLTSGQEYVYGGAGDLCTMYHRGEPHVEPNGRFCPTHCLPRVRRRDLGSAAMTAKNWNFFG